MSARRFMARIGQGAGQSGFSMVEVLVALAVISVGLLGVAKMNALAFSSTGVASFRSLAAIEAASMASSMRANRSYWSLASAAIGSITVANNTVSASNDATFVALATSGLNCVSAGAAASACSVAPVDVAAYDVEQWAVALGKALPTGGGTIVCETVSLPINCNINVTWTERTVSINSTGQAVSTNGQSALYGQQTYTLYVEP